MSVKVKICGVTNEEDARAALDLGADAIGLNFFPKSDRAISVSRARRIARAVPSGACLVGVFVNAAREHVAEVAKAVGLSALQFHGDEAPGDCVGWGSLIVIKALPAGDASVLARRAGEYPTRYVLVDTPSAAYGGTGETFDWETLGELPRDRLILAGGLTPENVGEAIRRVSPAGVDVASGVERSRGIKDHERLRAFIEAAKGA